MVYVLAIFAWFALVLLGVGLIVALEPVWNREAQAVAARSAVGCGRRATPRQLAVDAPRHLSPCHELQAA
jgi:fructose-1,6-bisphosphatase/sedoheptulose 1,7-bisphosphatase-like protein